MRKIKFLKSIPLFFISKSPPFLGMAAVTGPAGLGDSVPGPGGASAGASAKGETRDTERDEKSEKNTKTDTKRHKDKLFSKTTKSQALMVKMRNQHLNFRRKYTHRDF